MRHTRGSWRRKSSDSPSVNAAKRKRRGKRSQLGHEVLESRVLLAAVTIQATDANAAEAGANVAIFTVSRGTAVSTPLTVYYGISGTAANGSDYASLYGSVTIAANQASASITATPVDDALVEGNETVILTVGAGAGYTIGSPASATATIADNDSLPIVTIDSSDSNAAEPGTDTATLIVSRTGSTAASLTGTYTVGGPATAGPD